MIAEIVIRDIHQSFGSHQVLRGVNLEVRAGRARGLLGPNGAGKTSLFRVLLELARPDSGAAEIAGTTMAKLAEPARTVGAVIDVDGIHPKRSGRQHLQILVSGAGLHPDRVDACLDLVGLADVAKRAVGTYSQGMRQRLAIAGALLGEPKILVLDEPINGLDPDGIFWLRDLVRRFCDDGGAVLVSSHLLAELSSYIDDISILRDGVIVVDGTLDEVANGDLESAYRASERPEESAGAQYPE